MEKLLSFLRKWGPLSQELIQRLRLVLHSSSYKKGDFLIRQGNICDYVWFLETGIIHCFKMEDSDRISTWLYGPETVVYLPVSFNNRTESVEYLQAEEDSVVWRINHADLLNLYDDFPETRLMEEKIMRATFRAMKEHSDMKNMHNKVERYNYLLEFLGPALNQVNAEIVASLMNVSRRDYFNIKQRIWRNGK